MLEYFLFKETELFATVFFADNHINKHIYNSPEVQTLGFVYFINIKSIKIGKKGICIPFFCNFVAANFKSLPL